MLSLSVKSHWRLAYRTFLKAIKVTLQDIKQQFKAQKYRMHIIDDLDEQRYFFKVGEKWGKR
ncbi:hypothetical protein [Rosettibacter firmus]|uniref:hypothetical protein n=1 Tax=Rosettibacter firmus TaxID=3111522 RepID=UPI00336BEF31